VFSTLTGEDLNAFYAYLSDCGLSGSTAQKYHSLIHAAYKFAVKREYIDCNPCDFAERPKAEKYHADYYDKDELNRLLFCSHDEPIYIPILLAAFYGLRRSEALGLKWSNIDFEGKKISIAHKVVEEKLGGKYRTVGHDKMKTKSSNRTLPLISFVEKELQNLKIQQDMQRKLCRSAYCEEYKDYVCTDKMGRLLRPNYVTTQFGKLLKKHGLRKIRYHDLRHSCASLLLANGVEMKQIQEWLGYSNYQTTADVYSHLDFKSKENSAEIIAGLLAG
jgi:integrase